MSLSSMITLPSSSGKGFYSCWNAYSRVASPASSYNLSPPISPPSSPSRMLILPSGSASGNGLYSSWNYYTSVASSAGSGGLSPPMSRASSPLHAIGEVFAQRASWPVAPQLPLTDRQYSDSESRSSMVTTSVSFSYSVKSINSRKSRLAVRYPRPVRPQRRLSGVESIPESAGTSLESLSQLSSRPVSLSMSPRGNLGSIAENEHVVDAMETLSILFDSSPGDHFTFERRLSASWEALLKIKDYEERHATPNLRATTIFADTLLCVHNEIIETHSVGAQELIQPCIGLNKAFEDAYNLLYNSELYSNNFSTYRADPWTRSPGGLSGDARSSQSVEHRAQGRYIR
ncbi:hypothetical protein F5888DRAFT_1057428 [Russula emetica]|nr:hypothetical protein F5888DRAFT_1057428 [Russula emetica]